MDGYRTDNHHAFAPCYRGWLVHQVNTTFGASIISQPAYIIVMDAHEG